ncbi:MULTISPECIES: glycolate oxidase subunit GlcF [unclassified Thioalkalivibrio]|uniref:glycolate oxidase subunit GlcF n=1 Tax=unclassified Thioalkalivibrio TaxID=2621013 RepID=UPI000361C4AB|nr:MULTISPECIES: glycolate oxidase subunit GlcF [unclassified Thioalkalivibrio]
METRLHPRFENDPAARIAEDALRACVHCGFCNATCPTYQEQGDELDGPRGRIYQIKEVLESGEANATTRTHLDRCLTCLNCMTTCPSGVDYNHLVAVGREVVERDLDRPWRERLLRGLLARALPARWPFRLALGLGRLARPALPARLKRRVPPRQATGAVPRPANGAAGPGFQHGRVLLLGGCVHDAIDARINTALRHLLARRGVEVVETGAARCCGAVEHHLAFEERTRARVRANLDAWQPVLERGVDAVVSTASGCGVLLRDYGHILADDPTYAERAARLAECVRDPVELFDAEAIRALGIRAPDDHPPVAWHAPCTLQHGQALPGRVEPLLQAAGFNLVPVIEPHLCCGSAGTYSILQPEMAGRLRQRKLDNLEAAGPARIVTANIGCQTHMQSGTDTPVEHWLTLLERHCPATPAGA